MLNWDTATDSELNHSPSSDDPDGNGLLQLPGRSIDDITAHLDPLAAHPRLVKDIYLEKMWTNVRTDENGHSLFCSFEHVLVVS